MIYDSLKNLVLVVALQCAHTLIIVNLAKRSIGSKPKNPKLNRKIWKMFQIFKLPFNQLLFLCRNISSTRLMLRRAERPTRIWRAGPKTWLDVVATFHFSLRRRSDQVDAVSQIEPVYFRFLQDKCSTNLTINDESIDGVLGIQTRESRMVGTNKSTKLWRHPSVLL